ncbi:recombinase family protein, partial [Rhodovulum sp. BSW8]|uniref:recombinase family protein n=1 Tax=Rhodovulum sp. BSW8 TaxID=2259645 RepID=UPI000E07E61C
MTTRTAAPRAAICARYSTDLQSAASIPDQVRLCRRLGEERDWRVAEVFADKAMSGVDLPPLGPSFITRVCGFEIGSLGSLS